MYNKLCRAAAVVTLLCMITAALFGCSLKPEADPSEGGRSAVPANADPYTIETWGGNQSNETGDNNAVGSVPQTASAERTKATEKTQVRVTIPEGYSFMQIANLLESKGVCTAKDFYDVCQSYSPKSFSIPSSSDRCFKMEGYLFPDTYDFYTGDSPRSVLIKMLNNFHAKVGDIDDDTLILASMIEKEARSSEHMRLVSSVFHNRLRTGGDYKYLNCDPTREYVNNYITGNPLVADQSKYAALYNTCNKRVGLPAGPICCPGLKAIDAARNPADTNYYYFFYGKDNTNHYSETLEEHNRQMAEIGVGG